jgi:low affinity Fe/Cu permease
VKLVLRLVRRSPDVVGSPWALVLSVVSVLAWLAIGPLVGFSDAWLVFPATATSIGAFLIVFLIQYTQNRDTAAMQLKLDELIRGLTDARTHLVGLEHLSDEEFAEISEEFHRIRQEQVGQRPPVEPSQSESAGASPAADPAPRRDLAASRREPRSR